MRTPILKVLPALAIGLALPVAAQAAKPAAAATSESHAASASVDSAAKRLNTLREQNLLLQAMLKGETLRAKIRQAEGKDAGGAAPGPGGPTGLSASGSGSGAAAGTGEPLSSPSTHSTLPPRQSGGKDKSLYSKSFPAPGVAPGQGGSSSKGGEVAHAHHTPPSASAPQASSPAVPSDLPQVLAVWTLGKAQSAALKLSSGGQVNVAVGDSVPGGGLVKKVSSRGVKVSYGGASRWLPFAKSSNGARGGEPIRLPPLGNGAGGGR